MLIFGTQKLRNSILRNKSATVVVDFCGVVDRGPPDSASRGGEYSPLSGTRSA